MAECSEVALFEKTFVIFKIKSMMHLYTEVPVIVLGQKHILIVLIAPVRIKILMSYELAR